MFLKFNTDTRKYDILDDLGNWKAHTHCGLGLKVLVPVSDDWKDWLTGYIDHNGKDYYFKVTEKGQFEGKEFELENDMYVQLV